MRTGAGQPAAMLFAARQTPIRVRPGLRNAALQERCQETGFVARQPMGRLGTTAAGKQPVW